MLFKYYFIILLSSVWLIGFSQEKLKKEIPTRSLNEVVVVGHFEPQSIDKSVFNVKLISREDIKNQSSNNLSDVLNQYLNIVVKPNSETGVSKVSLFGLDGQYFKILVDNVPLVSDSGWGNNIDLTQINIEDIEQIEIIEGSMGVTHGGNAVSGVLNIISKKSSQYQWEVSAVAQEETVGKEYNWYDWGKHIQSLKINHNFSDHFFINIGGNRNDFKGYFDNRKGKDYTSNDGLRGYCWLPKEQYNLNALLSFKKDPFRIFYKFDYFDENIYFANSVVSTVYTPEKGLLKYAKDKRYITQRFYHHINITGKLFNDINYNLSISQQEQKRIHENYNYYFNGVEEGNQREKNQEMRVLYSKGTLSPFSKKQNIWLQFGYEWTNNMGFSVVDGPQQIKEIIRKRLENYDFFAITDIKATKDFSIRPGLRYSFQNIFKNQYASSLVLKYLIPYNIELRATYGKSFRTPNFEELYSRIDFSGHHFFGNPNLQPENATYYELNIKKNDLWNSGFALTHNIAMGYMNVDHRIDMVFTGSDPLGGDPIYQYINISKYKRWNIDISPKIAYKNYLLRTGFSFVGISRLISRGLAFSNDRFIYSFQANINFSYSLPKWNTVFSVYCKFNGKQQQYVMVYDQFKLSDIPAYAWMDVSLRKSFYSRRIELATGVRNLLDVIRIQQSQPPTNAGHTDSADILLGYGRSYYLKLNYNLNL